MQSVRAIWFLPSRCASIPVLEVKCVVITFIFQKFMWHLQKPQDFTHFYLRVRGATLGNKVFNVDFLCA